MYRDCGRHYDINNSIAIGARHPNGPHLKYVVSLLYADRRTVNRSLKRTVAGLASHVKAGFLGLDAWLELSHKARTLEEMADQNGEAQHRKLS